MKKAIGFAAAAIVLSTGVIANEQPSEQQFFGGQFSGSLKIATDYVFRGESEVVDGEIPAVQGTFNWTHKNGTYAGLFSSTNKFATTPDIYAVVGPYMGKFGQFGDSGIGYNVMVFHYMYPGAENLDYTELWLKVNKDFGPVNLELEITPTLNEWFAVDGWYGVNYALHPKTTFDNGIQLSGSIGYQGLSGHGAEGWAHWNVGINKDFYGINLDVRYHDSDVDSSHLVYGSADGLKIFDQRLVFSVTKIF